MSISGVSSSSVSNPLIQQDSQRQQLLALTKAIDSGDLSGAQQAYSDLTSSQNGSGPDPNSPLGQALAQIGKDLQSGDIGAAQQTLTALRSQVRGHRHHHHAPPPDPSGSTQSGPPAGPSPASNVIDIKA
jgi:hypothetical protein